MQLSFEGLNRICGARCIFPRGTRKGARSMRVKPSKCLVSPFFALSCRNDTVQASKKRCKPLNSFEAAATVWLLFRSNGAGITCKPRPFFRLKVWRKRFVYHSMIGVEPHAVRLVQKTWIHCVKVDGYAGKRRKA